MDDSLILAGIALALLAGLAILAGAVLASLDILKAAWLREEVRHGITAFGGGALISAIALVLVPDGALRQPAYSVLLTFLAGGVVFMGVDMALARSGSRLSQFLAMMLDFVPEAIVLGAVIGQNFAKAAFLALVIAAQNLPEGYAAFVEAKDTMPRGALLRRFMLVALSGPLWLAVGWLVFVDLPTLLGMLMTFCAGGILYLVFEDIAPRAVMARHWLPPLGTVLGFMVGLAGYLYV